MSEEVLIFGRDGDYTSENSIAIIWCIGDVRQVIKDYELAIELTDDECMEVLGFVDSKHDANFGISWENIYQGIEFYFKDKFNKTEEVSDE